MVVKGLSLFLALWLVSGMFFVVVRVFRGGYGEMSFGNVSKSIFNMLKCGFWFIIFCELFEDNLYFVNISVIIKID